MKISLKNSVNKHTILLLLSGMFTLSALALATLPGLSVLLFPVSVAVASSLFIFDSTSKKLYILASFVICGACALYEYLIWGELYAFLPVLFSLIMGGVNFFCIKKDYRKSIAVAINTILAVVMIFLVLWLISYYATGSFEIADFGKYYSDIVRNCESDFISRFESGMALGNYSEADVADMMAQLKLLIKALNYSMLGVVCAFAFLILGISYKLLAVFCVAFSQDSEGMRSWRFGLSNLFVYFYLALFVLNSFEAGMDVLGVTVSSFYVLFTVAFAYIGFIFVRGFLAEKWRNRFLPTLLLVGVLFMFSLMAVELLAIFGAIGTLIETHRNSSNIFDKINPKE